MVEELLASQLGRECLTSWLGKTPARAGSCCAYVTAGSSYVRVPVSGGCLQMAIKQAMAYWATSDMRYADNAISIIEAWANTNKAFGLQRENGEPLSTPLLLLLCPPVLCWNIAAAAAAAAGLRLPCLQRLHAFLCELSGDVAVHVFKTCKLCTQPFSPPAAACCCCVLLLLAAVIPEGPLEAGWGLACMAKALEQLRDLPRAQAILPTFVQYVNTVLMPIMDTYVYSITLTAMQNGAQNVYGNWHTTIADAMITFGVLADDRDRYNKGLDLFKNATRDYLKWGRGTMSTVDGVQRVPGEVGGSTRSTAGRSDEACVA
jgi:hypothetical protein